MTPQQVVERDFIASQWRLMWRKFRRHRMAIIGGSVLMGLGYWYATNGRRPARAATAGQTDPRARRRGSTRLRT